MVLQYYDSRAGYLVRTPLLRRLAAAYRGRVVAAQLADMRLDLLGEPVQRAYCPQAGRGIVGFKDRSQLVHSHAVNLD